MKKSTKKGNIEIRYEISLLDYIKHPNLGLTYENKLAELDKLMANNERFKKFREIADIDVGVSKEIKNEKNSDVSDWFDFSKKELNDNRLRRLVFYEFAFKKELQESNDIHTVIVQKEDNGFVDFFTHKIKTLKPQDEYDDFLSYHQKKFEKDGIKTYINTLRIAIDKLNKDNNYSSHTFLIENFISKLLNERQGDFTIKRKYKGTREQDDGITALNQELTGYFFYLLYKNKAIFNDKEYLDREDLYLAIQVLTGYSNNTIKKRFKEAENDKGKNVPRRVKTLIESFIKIEKKEN